MPNKSILFAAIANSFICLACSGPKVFLMQTAYLVDAGGDESFAGGGCESVGGDGHGVSGLANENFSITHADEADGVRVTVRGATNTILAERFYSVDFLASGVEEEIFVELADGKALRLRYWGGPDCIAPDAG
jgi:hypothetical protein